MPSEIDSDDYLRQTDTIRLWGSGTELDLYVQAIVVDIIQDDYGYRNFTYTPMEEFRLWSSTTKQIRAEVYADVIKLQDGKWLDFHSETASKSSAWIARSNEILGSFFSLKKRQELIRLNPAIEYNFCFWQAFRVWRIVESDSHREVSLYQDYQKAMRLLEHGGAKAIQSGGRNESAHRLLYDEEPLQDCFIDYSGFMLPVRRHLVLALVISFDMRLFRRKYWLDVQSSRRRFLTQQNRLDVPEWSLWVDPRLKQYGSREAKGVRVFADLYRMNVSVSTE